MALSTVSEDWQLDKSLPESLLYMLDHGIGDVTFRICYKRVEEKEEEVIVVALQTLLLARSPVFCRMFASHLSEKTEPEPIDIDDVPPEAFKQMIRFMYTDDVALTPENVMAVMYAAKKYMVTRLTKTCVQFIKENICAASAPQLLDQSIMFDEQDLTDAVLAKMEDEASEVLASQEFTDHSEEGFRKTLKLELKVKSEMEVFDAAIRWAEKRCKDLKKTPHGPNIRDILGDSLYQIRFPAMGLEEFNDKVVPRLVLTESEGFKVFRYITAAPDKKPANIPFPTKSRAIPPVVATKKEQIGISPVGSQQQPFTPAIPAVPKPTWLLNDIRSRKTFRANVSIHGTDVHTHMKCHVSKPIRLNQIAIFAVDQAGEFNTTLSVWLTQRGKRLIEYTGGGRYNNGLKSGGPVMIIDIDDSVNTKSPFKHVKINCGEFEIEIKVNLKAKTDCKATFWVTSSFVSEMSDDDITIAFHPVSPNLLRGIEYTLV